MPRLGASACRAARRHPSLHQRDHSRGCGHAPLTPLRAIRDSRLPLTPPAGTLQQPPFSPPALVPSGPHRVPASHNLCFQTSAPSCAARTPTTTSPPLPVPRATSIDFHAALPNHRKFHHSPAPAPEPPTGVTRAVVNASADPRHSLTATNRPTSLHAVDFPPLPLPATHTPDALPLDTRRPSRPTHLTSRRTPAPPLPFYLTLPRPPPVRHPLRQSAHGLALVCHRDPYPPTHPTIWPPAYSSPACTHPVPATHAQSLTPMTLLPPRLHPPPPSPPSVDTTHTSPLSNTRSTTPCSTPSRCLL